MDSRPTNGCATPTRLPPGLYQAQDLLIERRAELHRQGLVAPEPPPPTTAQLIDKAAAITEPSNGSSAVGAQ